MLGRDVPKYNAMLCEWCAFSYADKMLPQYEPSFLKSSSSPPHRLPSCQSHLPFPPFPPPYPPLLPLLMQRTRVSASVPGKRRVSSGEPSSTSAVSSPHVGEKRRYFSEDELPSLDVNTLPGVTHPLVGPGCESQTVPTAIHCPSCSKEKGPHDNCPLDLLSRVPLDPLASQAYLGAAQLKLKKGFLQVTYMPVEALLKNLADGHTVQVLFTHQPPLQVPSVSQALSVPQAPSEPPVSPEEVYDALSKAKRSIQRLLEKEHKLVSRQDQVKKAVAETPDVFTPSNLPPDRRLRVTFTSAPLIQSAEYNRRVRRLIAEIMAPYVLVTNMKVWNDIGVLKKYGLLRFLPKQWQDSTVPYSASILEDLEAPNPVLSPSLFQRHDYGDWDGEDLSALYGTDEGGDEVMDREREDTSGERDEAKDTVMMQPVSSGRSGRPGRTLRQAFVGSYLSCSVPAVSSAHVQSLPPKKPPVALSFYELFRHVRSTSVQMWQETRKELDVESVKKLEQWVPAANGLSAIVRSRFPQEKAPLVMLVSLPQDPESLMW